MQTLRKYRGRVLFCLLFWAVIPLFLLINCVVYPAYWVFKFGIDNTCYWHNVYAGWLMTWQEVSEMWEIEK